jgi:hypothetical protein
LEPRKENFLKKVFLDLSKTLNSPKRRFGQRKEKAFLYQTVRESFFIVPANPRRKRSFRPIKVFRIPKPFFQKGFWWGCGGDAPTYRGCQGALPLGTPQGKLFEKSFP